MHSKGDNTDVIWSALTYEIAIFALLHTWKGRRAAYFLDK